RRLLCRGKKTGAAWRRPRKANNKRSIRARRLAAAWCCVRQRSVQLRRALPPSPRGRIAMHVYTAPPPIASKTDNVGDEQPCTTEIVPLRGHTAPTVDRVLNEHADEIRRLGKRVVANVIEIGRRLVDCRNNLNHGDWGGWLKSEFSWSRQTVDRF